MPAFESIPLIVVGVVTFLAAFTDIWKFKVYNLLTLPALGLGLLVSTALGGWTGLGAGLLGAGFGFGILVVFYALGGVGAGDVKLLTAVGAWLGPFWTVHVFIVAALAAGVYALGLLLVRGGPLAVAVEILAVRQAVFVPGKLGRSDADIAAEVARSDRRRRLVPFGAMICVGFFVMVVWWHARLGQVWPPYPMSPADRLAVASVTLADFAAGSSAVGSLAPGLEEIRP